MDGDSIRELREELGVSQQELARRLQVAHSTVYRWENGQSTPSGRVLARLLRLKRLKEFQNEGLLLSLSDLKAYEDAAINGLPPWHPQGDHIEPGHLSVVVSPPRCGKTLTALRWALEATRLHGVPIFYVSTHWTPVQTLHHLEKATESLGRDGLDSELPFHVFQHDGKDMASLLEELSHRMGEVSGAFVVIDWLQNLDYVERSFAYMELLERQLLRDLKLWAARQRVYVLVIASQRGISRCDIEQFPHFFELADSISVGSVQELRRRRVEFLYTDLHRGGGETFHFELPPKEAEAVSVPPTFRSGR
jgi:transcriptional regulator with XRE-family HTH domain